MRRLLLLILIILCALGPKHKLRAINSRHQHQPAHGAASLLLTSLFAAVIVGGVFGTVAHTACCFVKILAHRFA